MKNALVGFGLFFAISSCKTTTPNSKILGTENLQNDVVLNIFESVPLAPAEFDKNNLISKFYVGKAQDPAKQILTVLYSTDNYDIRIAGLSEVINLTEFGENFSWTEMKRNGSANGKFFKVENNVVSEFCAKESSKNCVFSPTETRPSISIEGKVLEVPTLKSYAMIKIKPEIIEKNDLQIKFQFEKSSFPANVADTDLTEYSLGIKCKETSYSVDYFSEGAANRVTLSTQQLAAKGQKSIWAHDGRNLLDDASPFKEDFKVENADSQIILKFSGQLLQQIRKECGERVKKSAIIVTGVLARPS